MSLCFCFFECTLPFFGQLHFALTSLDGYPLMTDGLNAVFLIVPMIGLHVVEPSGNKQRLHIEITFILTVCCSSQRVFFLGSAAAELILNTTTKPLRQRPDRAQLLLLLMEDDIHRNPGPTAKYPCPVCARDVTSR